MSIYIDIGFIVGLVLLSTIPLMKVSGRMERAMTRLALGLFRERVETAGRHRQKRKRLLQSVHSTRTYPVYASLTLLFTVIVGIAGSLIAVWLIQQSLLIVISSEAALKSAVPPVACATVCRPFAVLMRR